MYITPQQPSRQITVTEKENKNFYLAEMSLLLQNACFLNKKNVNVQMIVVACGIFETFGWQEHFNPRANIIHMQSLFIFFLKRKQRKLLICSYHALLLSPKRDYLSSIFDNFFLFLGMSWNNRNTEITVQGDLSFCVCVIHISTVDCTVDIKIQE